MSKLLCSQIFIVFLNDFTTLDIVIYKLIRFIFIFGVHGYFRKVEIAHMDRIPKKGPLIFVANHTSSFLDGVILAILLKREMHFLARGETFKSKFVRLILSWLNLIPVYRPEITPEKVLQNEGIFNRCFEHLAQGKCLLIFPEGFSVTERRIRQLKTGTARIALGAESKTGFKLELKIIPIGINYSDSHRFRSHLFLQVGEPINVNQYKEEYTNNKFGAAKSVTNDIKQALQKSTIVIENKESEALIDKLLNIFVHSGEMDTTANSKDLEAKFLASQSITAIVEHLITNDHSTYENLNTTTQAYVDSLRHHNVKNWHLNSVSEKGYLQKKAMRLALTLPFYIAGYTFNIVPFKIAVFVSDKSIIRSDFRGSMQLSFGVLFFLVFYILLSVLVYRISGIISAVFFFIMLYPLGLFAINYNRKFQKFCSLIQFKSFYKKNQKTVDDLISQRNAIIDTLKEIKLEITDPQIA